MGLLVNESSLSRPKSKLRRAENEGVRSWGGTGTNVGAAVVDMVGSAEAFEAGKYAWGFMKKKTKTNPNNHHHQHRNHHHSYL
jgi:hypothetical protein